MEQTIQLKHPAKKNAVSMDKGKYDSLKAAVLSHLKKKGEATHKELLSAVNENFTRNKIKFEGSVEWHMEWVKLDLEARKQIKRIANTSPIKFIIV
jgi:RNA:NAD 2'-phosphotransferase (TPT1/KptA family)